MLDGHAGANKDVRVTSVFVSDRTWAQINPLSQRTERLTASIWDTHEFNTFNHHVFTIHSSAEIGHKDIYRGHVTHMRKWHHKTCFPWRCHSTALEAGGGIKPATTNRLSLDRKLNVAHALGCKRQFSNGEPAPTCGFTERREREAFTVSWTSTAMPFFLRKSSTFGSRRSVRAPVPKTRTSARTPSD